MKDRGTKEMSCRKQNHKSGNGMLLSTNDPFDATPQSKSSFMPACAADTQKSNNAKVSKRFRKRAFCFVHDLYRNYTTKDITTTYGLCFTPANRHRTNRGQLLTSSHLFPGQVGETLHSASQCAADKLTKEKTCDV